MANVRVFATGSLAGNELRQDMQIAMKKKVFFRMVFIVNP